MQKKTEVPPWFYVTPEDMRYINATSIAHNAPIPNFVLGGPMCCFIQNRNCQCGGNVQNCPPHLRSRRRGGRR